MATLNVVPFDAQLTSAPMVVLAPGSLDEWLLLKVTVNNQDASDRTVTVYRVPASGSPDSTNIIINAQTILAGQTIPLFLSGEAVTDGQTLQALASVGGFVNINGTYVVIV